MASEFSTDCSSETEGILSLAPLLGPVVYRSLLGVLDVLYAVFSLGFSDSYGFRIFNRLSLRWRVPGCDRFCDIHKKLKGS